MKKCGGARGRGNYRNTGWAKQVGPQTHGHNSVKSEPIKKFTGVCQRNCLIGKYLPKLEAKASFCRALSLS